MKVYTKQVFQMHDDGSFELLESESYEYSGPVAQCFGGRTRSTTTATQVTETTNVGLQDTSGISVAGGRDVSLTLETTALVAIQGAFDFADSAFEFANDAAQRAGQISERAIETSQLAVATVATGGQSDLSRIDSKTIGIAIAALAAVFVLPQLFKRAA